MFLEYCLVRINSLISVVGDGSGFIFIIIEEKLSDFCQVIIKVCELFWVVVFCIVRKFRDWRC